jgi:hypothetical protein
MSYSLKIKNFQSIEDQELELKGFVAITGRSNLGKSGLRRALTAALYNDWDKSYRREGTNKPTEVTLSSSAWSIHMLKSSDNNDFTLTTAEGQQTFNKVGKDIPEQISALGFNLLDLEDEKLNLTSSKQTDPMFMVSFKQVTQTKVLNKLFNINKLVSASSLVQKDIRSFKMEHNKLLESYNSKSSDLSQLEVKQQEVTEQRDFLADTLNNLSAIDLWLDITEESNRLQTLQTETNDKIASLQGIKDQDLILTLLDEYKYNDSLEVNSKLTLGSIKMKLESLMNKVTELQEAEKTASKIKLIESFSSTTQEAAQISSRLSELDKHSSFINDFQHNRLLLNYLYQFDREGSANLLLTNNQTSIDVVQDSVGKFKALQLLANYQDSLNSQQSLTTKLSQLDNEIEATYNEKFHMESKLERCPTCGQLINNSHTHQGDKC